MLYKKIHRQYLRQFRVGREFKYKFKSDNYSVVCKVTKKLYIDDKNFVNVSCIGDCCEFTFCLISINSFSTGRFLYKDEFRWID